MEKNEKISDIVISEKEELIIEEFMDFLIIIEHAKAYYEKTKDDIYKVLDKSKEFLKDLKDFTITYNDYCYDDFVSIQTDIIAYLNTEIVSIFWGKTHLKKSLDYLKQKFGIAYLKANALLEEYKIYLKYAHKWC